MSRHIKSTDKKTASSNIGTAFSSNNVVAEAKSSLGQHNAGKSHSLATKNSNPVQNIKKNSSKGKISEKNGGGSNPGGRKMPSNNPNKNTNTTEMSNNESDNGRKKNGSLSKSNGKSQSRGKSGNDHHQKYAMNYNFADQVSNLAQNHQEQMNQQQIQMMGLPNMPQGDQY